MAKFRTRPEPIEVDAIRAEDAIKHAAWDWDRLPDWLRGAANAGSVAFAEDGVHISTLAGNVTARPQDWIVCAGDGDIYPCAADKFERRYEAVLDGD